VVKEDKRTSMELKEDEEQIIDKEPEVAVDSFLMKEADMEVLYYLVHLVAQVVTSKKEDDKDLALLSPI